jgi:site-specific recombinase XerD
MIAVPGDSCAWRHRHSPAFVARSVSGNGGDIHRPSRILGHTSISTTQVYLRSMGLEHLQEGHAKYSPVGEFWANQSGSGNLLSQRR